MLTKKRARARADSRAVKLALLKSIAHAIVQTFGPEACEVVIHDLADLAHSIIWIEGNVTGRHVGGSMTDLGLKLIRAGKLDDLFNYRTCLDDGKTLKSSSIFLRDDDGQVWGAFCINFNVTPLLNVWRFLESFLDLNDDQEIQETFTDRIEDTLQKMVADCASQIGKSILEMDRGERLDLIKMLDQKGAFQVRRAVPIIAQKLGVSRYTVYNYLNAVRGNGQVKSTS
jgi:predicted transcriptional regulator YheO